MSSGKRADHSAGDLNVRLTENAQERVEEYVRAARARLLSELYRTQGQTTEPRIVKTADVDKAIQGLSLVDRAAYVRQLRRRLLNYAGVAAAITLGIAAVAIAIAEMGVTKNDAALFWIGVLVSVPLSIAANFLSRVVVEYLNRRRSGKRTLEQQLLTRFVQLELRLRNYAASVSGDDVAAGQLSGVFDAVLQTGAWSAEDIQSFRQLLRLRNALVHEERVAIDVADIADALKIIDRLTDSIPKKPPIRGRVRS